MGILVSDEASQAGRFAHGFPHCWCSVNPFPEHRIITTREGDGCCRGGSVERTQTMEPISPVASHKEVRREIYERSLKSIGRCSWITWNSSHVTFHREVLQMNNKRTLKTAAVVIGLALVASPVWAVEDLTRNTPALHGYDAVSYFSEGKAVRGNGKHTHWHDGVSYLFSSEENKDTFAQAPERYLPQYGGFCAFGTSMSRKFDGDPEVWRIVDGRLYLNVDRDIEKTWFKDIPGNIVKADRNWPKIKDTPASEL